MIASLKAMPATQRKTQDPTADPMILLLDTLQAIITPTRELPAWIGRSPTLDTDSGQNFGTTIDTAKNIGVRDADFKVAV